MLDGSRCARVERWCSRALHVRSHEKLKCTIDASRDLLLWTLGWACWEWSPAPARSRCIIYMRENERDVVRGPLPRCLFAAHRGASPVSFLLSPRPSQCYRPTDAVPVPTGTCTRPHLRLRPVCRPVSALRQRARGRADTHPTTIPRIKRAKLETEELPITARIRDQGHPCSCTKLGSSKATIVRTCTDVPWLGGAASASFGLCLWG